MPKKSYALRNRRGSMDSTFNDGLGIVLHWMELRRRHAQLLLQKELYMLRRIWYPRAVIGHHMPGGLLPGSHTDYTLPVQEELNYMRELLQGRYYAPGY